ncbi:MAG: NAD-glutamate dehydrogenase [Pseudomonadales bacterium]|nr:NAD-glutamate dehydrogenase [Pseudomonadales bacterium]
MVNLSLGGDYEITLERLEEKINERFDRANSAVRQQIADFARFFYATAPLEELSRKRIDDLYGATIALWDFLQHRPENKPRIRVFNPKFEDHGWQGAHTIVEIIAPDRAFIVDSMMMEFTRRGVSIHSVMNAVFNVARNDKGELVDVDFSGKKSVGSPEALLHIEVDKETDEDEIKDVVAHLESIIDELEFAVCDFKEMLDRTQLIANSLQNEGSDKDLGLEEVKSFLHWLVDNHFTFLGMQEYKVVESGVHKHLELVPETSLGIVRGEEPIDLMESSGGPLTLANKLLVFGKSGTKSRIHRPAYMDFVAVRKFDDKGHVIGEYRLLGLYTSRVFNNSPRGFPIIGRKVDDVIKGSQLDPSGHDGKRLFQILETFPREELFQTPTEELLKTAVGILQIQERRRLRLFVRKGQFGRFVTCLIYTPREGYSTGLRKRFQQVLFEYVDATDLEFNTYFTESTLARLYIVMRVADDKSYEFDVAEAETRLVSLARSWHDRFHETLVESVGEEKAGTLFKKYADAFSVSYREDISTRTAVSDVEHMETLVEGCDISVSFYRAIEEDVDALRFKLFRKHEEIPLSDVLPMLENLGLRVLGGRPYHIRCKDAEIWIYEFSVRYSGEHITDLEAVKEKLQNAFDQVWNGHAENDSFNRLVLAVGLDWREVAVLRAYAKYFKQTGFAFSQTYIKEALINNAAITRLLVDLFYSRFAADNRCDKEREEQVVAEVIEGLELVDSLDEDRILRRYLDMVAGTLRTNFFQLDQEGMFKDYISLKLSPKSIPDLPKPLPEFEIFVYSPRVEGVHLRGGKVARGGLRWSDRKEDFRTEVLGLVKAQQVKNAVIVPVGAKGGFVAKKLPKTGGRDAVMAEVVTCYQTFIRGLLDITDNLVDGEVVPPEQVVRIDGDDTYLVVAADKGTATFSDIANEIAQEYNFWLGDAFASGGSIGYDHKKMGITAKGAWVSVQRHFREMGIDVQSTPFTALAIGDMAGDVFGNGMLRSRYTQLVAAFNHMHIFVDPMPDPEQSYVERERLFNLPRSSWQDYSEDLISQGGGVFLRSSKSIAISPQMKERFDISADNLTPNELIVALLKSPVDLIWNGGIGTYIKATTELNSDVGDKANDAIRINGHEVNAKVIGEGGNLGATQLGRIEFGLEGGRSNTDFIDNSGGVDCSDHEVNIKILLNDIVTDGDMTLKQRNKLLVDMTDEVSDLVLKNNYRQVQAISVAQTESVYRMGEYKRYIHALVNEGKLDRELEFIPNDEELHERLVNGKGLVRPELSTLLSYTKALLKDELSSADLTEDAYISREIERPFPKILVKKYNQAISNHKLSKQIIATQIANDLVNYMGITFVHRMKDAAGSSVVDIAKAFLAARDIFSLESWWDQIEALDYKVVTEGQMEMMRVLIRMIRRATRWLLRNNRCGVNVEEMVTRYQPGIKAVTDSLPSVLRGPRREVWEKRHNNYVESGVPSTLATFISGADSMQSALGIVQAAEITQKPVQEVATTYFEVGNRLDLYWFTQEINDLNIENHWQALAREAYRDDLEWQQRTLAVGVLQMQMDAINLEERIETWAKKHEELISRWRSMVGEFRATDTKEFSMYGVALRELMDIAQTTLHTDSGSSY